MMDEMKYREMYFELRREVEQAIGQLNRALWETEKRLLPFSGGTAPGKEEEKGRG